MPILVWLNENTELTGRIVCPLKTLTGDYHFDDDENVFLLFEYIEGETAGRILTSHQLIEAAEMMACLHRYGNDIPMNTDGIREEFSVPFSYSLERFISEGLSESPADVQAIIRPYIEQLLSRSNEVKLLSQKVKQKNIEMVLCHTDAHGYNLMQGDHLMLVDWECVKIAPAEADLLMFSKKAYWDVFIEHYCMLRPDFVLDNELLMFYILKRKIEDIWAFIEGLLFDDLSAEQRKRDLAFLSDCCNSLDDLWFEL